MEFSILRIVQQMNPSHQLRLQDCHSLQRTRKLSPLQKKFAWKGTSRDTLISVSISTLKLAKIQLCPVFPLHFLICTIFISIAVDVQSINDLKVKAKTLVKGVLCEVEEKVSNKQVARVLCGAGSLERNTKKTYRTRKHGSNWDLTITSELTNSTIIIGLAEIYAGYSLIEKFGDKVKNWTKRLGQVYENSTNKQKQLYVLVEFMKKQEAKTDEAEEMGSEEEMGSDEEMGFDEEYDIEM